MTGERITVIDGETIVVYENPPEKLIVADVGAQGPRGPSGPAGGTQFVYNQGFPSSVWTINHSLGRFPSVTVVDSTGEVVEGEIDYVDDNNITVTFSAPFSGTAYLN